MEHNENTVKVIIQNSIATKEVRKPFISPKTTWMGAERLYVD